MAGELESYTAPGAATPAVLDDFVVQHELIHVQAVDITPPTRFPTASRGTPVKFKHFFKPSAPQELIICAPNTPVSAPPPIMAILTSAEGSVLTKNATAKPALTPKRAQILAPPGVSDTFSVLSSLRNQTSKNGI